MDKIRTFFSKIRALFLIFIKGEERPPLSTPWLRACKVSNSAICLLLFARFYLIGTCVAKELKVSVQSWKRFRLLRPRKCDNYQPLLKGATKSYFTHFSCVVTILFNKDLHKSPFSTYSLKNQFFVFLSSVVFVCFVLISM